MKNIKSNRCEGNIKVEEKAVSSEKGSAEFTRVLGNTTGSHLTGSKENVYGDINKFTVLVEAETKEQAKKLARKNINSFPVDNEFTGEWVIENVKEV